MAYLIAYNLISYERKGLGKQKELKGNRVRKKKNQICIRKIRTKQTFAHTHTDRLHERNRKLLETKEIETNETNLF